MEQILVNGFVLSVNYALIALGITLIFSIMNILNFAHGQMFMIGGFVVYYLYGVIKLNYFLSLIAVVIGTLVVQGLLLRFRKLAHPHKISCLLGGYILPITYRRGGANK